MGDGHSSIEGITDHLATINSFFQEYGYPNGTTSEILGVVLENLLHFSADASYIKERAKPKNRVLEELAGTTWG